MEFLGVGPLELLFIILIMLIVLGPEDMVKTGRTLGRFLRRIVTSETWLQFRQVTREVSTLPNKLMKEAGLEELDRTLKAEGQVLQDIKQVEESLAKDLDFDRMAKKIAFSETLAQGTPDETTAPDQAAPEPPAEAPASAESPTDETA